MQIQITEMPQSETSSIMSGLKIAIYSRIFKPWLFYWYNELTIVLMLSFMICAGKWTETTNAFLINH